MPEATIVPFTQPNPNQPSATGGADDAPADTDAEFQALYADAQEGKQRLLALALAAEQAQNADVAKIYREIAGTVLTLFADMAAACGGAIVNVESAVGELQDGDGGERIGSALTDEDAGKYLALFDQYVRLLDGLTALVPAGGDGDAQREIFETLRRMTDGMILFTKELNTAEDEDEPENEGDGNE
jgi:hypothetical protein